MPEEGSGSKEDSKDSTITKPLKTNAAGEDYKFFNTSWQALVKTSTMFSGEFVSPFNNLYLRKIDVVKEISKMKKINVFLNPYSKTNFSGIRRFAI